MPRTKSARAAAEAAPESDPAMTPAATADIATHEPRRAAGEAENPGTQASDGITHIKLPWVRGASDQEPPPAAKDAAAGPATAEGERRPFPDVTEQKTIRVSPDGDMLRLRRSRRYNQMQLSPDGALPDWAKERLKADGWRDRVEDEGIYTKQLPPRPKPDDATPPPPAWPVVIEAERFFEQLVNDLRTERKMPPVRLNTAAVAER